MKLRIQDFFDGKSKRKEKKSHQTGCSEGEEKQRGTGSGIGFGPADVVWKQTLPYFSEAVQAKQVKAAAAVIASASSEWLGADVLLSAITSSEGCSYRHTTITKSKPFY